MGHNKQEGQVSDVKRTGAWDLSVVDQTKDSSIRNSYVSILTLFYSDLLDELSQNNDGVDLWR